MLATLGLLALTAAASSSGEARRLGLARLAGELYGYSLNARDPGKLQLMSAAVRELSVAPR